ncbi:hypothetical protein gpAD87_22380 [Paenibacillus sp. AD87]|nr:hypothetical protein gpAD87_22380 [Paenibacillus sp. AD87]
MWCYFAYSVTQVICIELSNYLTYNEKSYLGTLAR